MYCVLLPCNVHACVQIRFCNQQQSDSPAMMHAMPTRRKKRGVRGESDRALSWGDKRQQKHGWIGFEGAHFDAKQGGRVQNNSSCSQELLLGGIEASWCSVKNHVERGRLQWRKKGGVGEGRACCACSLSAAARRPAFAIACRAPCGRHPLARSLPPQAVGQRVAAGQKARGHTHTGRAGT